MNAVANRPVGKPNCFGLALPYGIRTNYALPYIVCRGVMVGMAYTGKSAHLREVFTAPTEIARWGDGVVYQTAGERLDQNSAELYLELAQIALAQAFAPNQRILVDISADALSERLGWGRGGQQRVRLYEQVNYLKTASFMYDFPGLRGWHASFVSDIKTDMSIRKLKAPSHYTIELSASMLEVYAEGTKIVSGKIRRQLRGKPLALALHAFYCTHAVPGEYSAATLKRIMSRESTEESDWRPELDAALAAMDAAAGWTSNYNRKTGKVSVCKSKVVTDEDEDEPQQDAASDAGKAQQDTPAVDTKSTDETTPAAAPSSSASNPLDAIKKIADIERLSSDQQRALFGPKELAEYAEYLASPIAYTRTDRQIREWIKDRAGLAWIRRQEELDPSLGI